MQSSSLNKKSLITTFSLSQYFKLNELMKCMYKTNTQYLRSNLSLSLMGFKGGSINQSSCEENIGKVFAIHSQALVVKDGKLLGCWSVWKLDLILSVMKE